MGTRHLIMVIAGGETKIAQYGQWDGYPDGQGVEVLNFLKQIDLRGEWKTFYERVRALNWLTKEQSEEIEKDENWPQKHPYLSRDAGARILYAVHFHEMEVNEGYGKRKKVPVKITGLVDSTAFAADSLFCEWAYVIDLDKKVLEVYSGFNQNPVDETHRFYHLNDKTEGEYGIIALEHTFSLDELPSREKFLSVFEKSEDNE